MLAAWCARGVFERSWTGLVIDMGESQTHVTPVVEGVVIVADVMRFPITGRTVTST
jgi:actin-related protein 3